MKRKRSEGDKYHRQWVEREKKRQRVESEVNNEGMRDKGTKQLELEGVEVSYPT